MKQRTLNHRQQEFLKHYFSCHNATQALVRAGYKTKYPDRYASELMAKPQIQAELVKTRERVSQDIALTLEYKLAILEDGIKYYADSNEYEKAGRLIEIANKMQGHNAREKNTDFYNAEQLAQLEQLTNDIMRQNVENYQRQLQQTLVREKTDPLLITGRSASC